MSPNIAPDATPNLRPNQTDSASRSVDSATTNHDMPARSAAEDEIQRPTDTDDAATMAASEELRHTTISDRANSTAEQRGSEPDAAPLGGDEEMDKHARSNTPEHDKLKESLSSPKKKRGRDFEDDMRDMGEFDTCEKGSATVSGTVNISRTSRSEPEKKRPRDTSEETTTATKEAATAKVSLIINAYRIAAEANELPGYVSCHFIGPEERIWSAKRLVNRSKACI